MLRSNTRQAHGNRHQRKWNQETKKAMGRREWGGGREGYSNMNSSLQNILCNNTKLHVNCARFIAKRFGRLLKHVFIFIECSSERGCWRERKMWIYVAWAALWAGGGALCHQCQLWGTLFLSLAAAPSPQRLLQLILEQLLAGVGRITIDRDKQWDFTSLKLP